MNEFSDVFNNQPGRTNVIEHRIILTTNKPIRQCPYRIPKAYRDKVKKEIEEMEENDTIRKSKSELASPLVIVPKKDGSLRLCVDFRRLNAVSEFDAYPIPLVEEVLDRMGSVNYLSTLDMTKGYWQISLAEESKDNTAFITEADPDGDPGVAPTLRKKRPLIFFCAPARGMQQANVRSFRRLSVSGLRLTQKSEVSAWTFVEV